MDEPTEILFYDVTHRCQISVPFARIQKSVYKQASRHHYILIAQLNGTVLRKFVRREDWLELDVPQI